MPVRPAPNVRPFCVHSLWTWTWTPDLQVHSEADGWRLTHLNAGHLTTSESLKLGRSEINLQLVLNFNWKSRTPFYYRGPQPSAGHCWCASPQLFFACYLRPTGLRLPKIISNMYGSDNILADLIFYSTFAPLQRWGETHDPVHCTFFNFFNEVTNQFSVLLSKFLQSIKVIWFKLKQATKLKYLKLEPKTSLWPWHWFGRRSESSLASVNMPY